MRIYLIGFMGCGKSTLGRKLAAFSGMQFIDMDKFIEERYRKTVPQIFAEEGELEFRKKERKVIEELSVFQDIIIATGGGAPCFFDNMELMNKTGLTVYLNIHPEILSARLLKSKTERPLIKGKTYDELVKYIEDTLDKRDKYYKKARLCISKPDADIESVMEMIRKNAD